MVCEIVCVGTEILMGNIVNTNACFLARELSALGINSYYQVVVGDNEERLYSTIETALSRADILILSGGLGPTKDDLTKEVTANVLNKKLVLDLDTRKHIASIFEKLGRKEVTENNWKQAITIEGATIVKNNNGTAPGIIVKTEDNKVIVLLPGPPNELIPMVKNDIVPFLSEFTNSILYSKMVKVCGIGESQAETMIEDIIAEQTNPTIAPYAKTGEVHFRVTASAKTKAEGEELLSPVIDELYKRFENNIYTLKEEETLADVVYQLLKSKNQTLAVAESCTGGLLSSTLIDIDGVSAVYKEGFITYSNEAKEKYLGVDHNTLSTYGAVSEETAYEMAKGVLERSKSDASIAITGIAGPTGGTEEKPVGLVYIGVGYCGNVTVYKHQFYGTRQKVRESAVVAALNRLRCILM